MTEVLLIQCPQKSPSKNYQCGTDNVENLQLHFLKYKKVLKLPDASIITVIHYNARHYNVTCRQHCLL